MARPPEAAASCTGSIKAPCSTDKQGAFFIVYRLMSQWGGLILPLCLPLRCGSLIRGSLIKRDSSQPAEPQPLFRQFNFLGFGAADNAFFGIVQEADLLPGTAVVMFHFDLNRDRFCPPPSHATLPDTQIPTGTGGTFAGRAFRQHQLHPFCTSIFLYFLI